MLNYIKNILNISSDDACESNTYYNFTDSEEWIELYEFQKSLRNKHNVSIAAFLLKLNIPLSMSIYLKKPTGYIYPDLNRSSSDGFILVSKLKKLKKNYNGSFENTHETLETQFDRFREKYNNDLFALYVETCVMKKDDRMIHIFVDYYANNHKDIIDFFKQKCSFISFDEWSIEFVELEYL